MNEPRTFEKKAVKSVGAIIIVSLVLSVLFYFVISYMSFNITINIKLIVSGALGFIVGICAVLSNKTVSVTIDDEFVTYTKGDKVEKFPLEYYAGTNVVRNYTNGCYIGSTRYLKFNMPGNNIKQIEIPFDEKDYSDIVALIISHNNNVTEEVKEEIRESFNEEKSFPIPRDELYERLSKSRKIRAFFSCVTLAISLGVCIAAYVLTEFFMFLGIVIVFGVMGPTLAYFIFFYGRKESTAAMESTPSCLSFDSGSISFDDTTFDASRIQRVVATPPTYNTIGKNFEYRTIVITDTIGSEHTYYIGRSSKGDKKMMVPDYSAIVSTLETWCFSNNIDFRKDLG